MQDIDCSFRIYVIMMVVRFCNIHSKDNTFADVKVHNEHREICIKGNVKG